MSAKAFDTTGPIKDFDNTVYIERKEDKEVLNYIREGEHVTILGARQIGKTSLLYNVRRQLEEGYILIYIDLSAGDAIEDEEKWYQQFICKRILAQVNDSFPSDVRKQKVLPAKSKIEFLNFLNQIGLGVKYSDRIVIMLDEFGTVPEFLHDNFFGAIRVVDVERSSDREGFRKWIFVFAGAHEPQELIQGPNSPFNVTRRIYMSDFDKKDTCQVVENLKAHEIQLENEDKVIDCIYELTGGHPNLVQGVCDYLVRSNTVMVSTASVIKSIDDLISLSSYDLRRIYNEINKNDKTKQFAIQILEGEKLKFDRSNIEIAKLELIGMIKKDEMGFCIIRNPIYERRLREYLREELDISPKLTSDEIEDLKTRLIRRHP